MNFESLYFHFLQFLCFRYRYFSLTLSIKLFYNIQMQAVMYKKSLVTLVEFSLVVHFLGGYGPKILNIERNWWSKVSPKFSLVRLRQLLIHVLCLFMALFPDDAGAGIQVSFLLSLDVTKCGQKQWKEGASRDHSNLSSVIQFLSYKRKYYAKSISRFSFGWKMDRHLLLDTTIK